MRSGSSVKYSIFAEQTPLLFAINPAHGCKMAKSARPASHLTLSMRPAPQANSNKPLGHPDADPYTFGD